jgi:hypothetical protein
MARPRHVISPKRPAKSALENLPPEADAWVRNPSGLSVAPDPAGSTPGPEIAEPTDTQTAEPDRHADASPGEQDSVGSEQRDASRPEQGSSGQAASSLPQSDTSATGRQARPSPPQPQTGRESPASQKPVKFTLDVPLNLHRAMKIQTIKRRTTIVATVRTILGNYYGRTPDISPGEYKVSAAEPTKRLTLDLDPDLHTEMMLQKVLRQANIQAEVLHLVANHYLPGEEVSRAAATG